VDIVVRGGTLIDGTGSPAVKADVGIENGRITEVKVDGSITGSARHTIDATGMVVSPGFIDIHTHYDVQPFWDPDFTPSCWHGVTTVVTGNCGFGVAPTKAEHREIITRTLERVEGMNHKTLEEAIDWNFESFPEYLELVDRLPKRLNVAAMLGHTPLRLYVMGEEALERPATDDEIREMRALVDEGLAAGAVGFATSKSPAHRGALNKPVPSRMADVREIRELVAALGAAGKGTLQATVGPELLLEEFAYLSKTTGRPVTWAALLTGMAGLDTYRNAGGMEELAHPTGEILDRQAALGGEVWPQVAGLPLAISMKISNPTGAIALTPSFRYLLSEPVDRWDDICRDPTWRASAVAETDKSFGDQWGKVSIDASEHHEDLFGRPFDELAREMGKAPLEVLVDIAVDDHYTTRFKVLRLNDDETELAGLLPDRRVVLGLSDAGAHVDQLCDARFATHLLAHWVREKQALSLENAIWKLSGQPARVFRLEGRGTVAPGNFADLVVLDPDTVGPDPIARTWDFPGGADRLVSKSRGVHHVIVNGVVSRRDGDEIDAHAGRLLRS
jgi:N-acyl-D-aspartate/D-glutamate deacylase